MFRPSSSKMLETPVRKKGRKRLAESTSTSILSKVSKMEIPEASDSHTSAQDINLALAIDSDDSDHGSTLETELLNCDTSSDSESHQEECSNFSQSGNQIKTINSQKKQKTVDTSKQKCLSDFFVSKSNLKSSDSGTSCLSGSEATGEDNEYTSGRSIVWNFFKKINRKEAQCLTCSVIIETPTSTTTVLIRHIARHPAKQTQYDALIKEKSETEQKKKKHEGEKQATLDAVVKPKFTPSHPRAKAITNKVGILLAKARLPYDFVHNEGFQELLEHLEPRYNLPSRTTFSRNIIPNMYTDVKQSLQSLLTEDLKSMESISFTTDLWTCDHPYISLTTQYLDNDMNMKHFNLGCSHFPESHTGDNIKFKIKSLLSEWNVQYTSVSVPIYVISDNAPNMVCGLDDKCWEHHRCAAHSIQLAVTHAKGTAGYNNMLNKVRNIVSSYHHSSAMRQNLLKRQIQLHKPQHDLFGMCPTRFSSEFIMLERFIEQREPITLDMSMTGKGEQLTNMEWQLAEGAVMVLGPAAHMTTSLCSEEKPTFSMVLPALYCLDKKLSELISSKSFKGCGVLFARNLRSALDQKCSHYQSSKSHVLAMLVDPRFRDHILDAEMKRTAVQWLEEEVEQRLKKYSEDANSPSSSPDTSQTIEENSRIKTSSALWGPFQILSQRISKNQSKSTGKDLEAAEVATKEVKNYLMVPNIGMDDDALVWWRQNRSRFPSLAPIAQKYLGIPATEVPSERLFSAAGNVITPLRENLTADHAEQLIFLNKNLPKHEKNRRCDKM